MKKENTAFTKKMVENVRKIMNDRGLTQATIADYMGTSASQFSKILNGEVQLSLDNVSNLATKLNLREMDIITYPEIYVSKSEIGEENDLEAVLQIKLRKDKKDQVLKLVFGEHDIEILNK